MNRKNANRSFEERNLTEKNMRLQALRNDELESVSRKWKKTYWSMQHSLCFL